jgi:hypothetical protein
LYPSLFAPAATASIGNATAVSISSTYAPLRSGCSRIAAFVAAIISSGSSVDGIEKNGIDSLSTVFGSSISVSDSFRLILLSYTSPKR